MHRARRRSTTATIAVAVCLLGASPAVAAPDADGTDQHEAAPGAHGRDRAAEAQSRRDARRHVDDTRAASAGEPRGRVDSPGRGATPSARGATPPASPPAAAGGPQGRVDTGGPPGRDASGAEAGGGGGGSSPGPTAPDTTPPPRREAGITPGDGPRGTSGQVAATRGELSAPTDPTTGPREPIADPASPDDTAAGGSPTPMGPAPLAPAPTAGAAPGTPSGPAAAPSDPATPPRGAPDAVAQGSTSGVGEGAAALAERTRRAVSNVSTALPARTLDISGTLAVVVALYLLGLRWLDRGRLPMARLEEGRESDAQLVL